MKNIFLTSALLSLAFISCNDEKKLQEIQIPDAPIAETKTVTEDFGNPSEIKAEGKFQMLGLKYNYDALNKVIDPKTVFIHYSKHHLGYANNLNKAIVGSELEKKSIEEILIDLDINNFALRNNAGGYYNHNLYWDILSNTPGVISPELDQAIITSFGSKDELINKLKDAAAKQFGSGWSWLVVTKDGKLAVTATANQDNPLMPNATVKGTPILGIDVWEHAYYLNYQNNRAKYLENIFEIIDWKSVSEHYAKAIKA